MCMKGVCICSVCGLSLRCKHVDECVCGMRCVYEVCAGSYLRSVFTCVSLTCMCVCVCGIYCVRCIWGGYVCVLGEKCVFSCVSLMNICAVLCVCV